MIKKILFTTVSLLVCFMAMAQVDSPYLEDSLMGTKITIKAKSNIYLPNQEQASKIYNAAVRRLYYTFFLNPDFFKPKRISKQTDLLVNGFIKTNKDMYYDMYTVVYNEKLYLVYPSDVVDNTLIENKNSQIEEHYSHLLEDLASKQSAYDDLLKKKEIEVESALRDIQRREDNHEALVDSLYEDMVAKRLNPMKEAYAIWYDGLSTSVKKTADNLAITKSTLYSANSAGGCDYYFEFTNNSKKTIKYLYWYGNIYNEVGDKVDCYIRDTYNFQGRITGPYEPGERGGSMWECIIYNSSAKDMRLSRVKIDYTDGTSLTISGKDLAEITGAPESTIHKFEFGSIRREAESNFSKSISEDRFVWSRIKDYLSYFDRYITGPDEVRAYYDDIKALKKELEGLKETVRKFEDVNFIVK